MSVPVTVPTIRIYAGDDFGIEYRFKNADGTDADISDYGDWVAQWRPSTKSDEVVPFTVTQIGSGVLVEMDGDTTRTISDGVFDLQATSSAGIRTFFRGSVMFLKDVTR